LQAITDLERAVECIKGDLERFVEYIGGEDSRILENHLRHYNGRLPELNYNYHTLKINSYLELQQSVNKLLESLNIPSSTWESYYKNESIYSLLLQLNREGHLQIEYILKLLDRKNWKKYLFFTLLAAGGMASLVGLLFLQPFYPLLLMFKNLFASAIGMPVLNLLYTAVSTTGWFIYNYTNQKITSFNRLRDNFFLLASASLSITAYSLWILMAAPMTPLIAYLSLAACAVNVCRELFCLVQEHYRSAPLIHENEWPLVHQAYARQHYGDTKHLTALTIDLFGSLFLLGVIAAWSLLPGVLSLTIALTSIGLIHGLKYVLHQVSDAWNRANLQVLLKEIPSHYADNVSSRALGQLGGPTSRASNQPSFTISPCSETKEVLIQPAAQAVTKLPAQQEQTVIQIPTQAHFMF
jgi:hypothetical protein